MWKVKGGLPMKVKLKYKNFLFLTIAGIINAFGVTVFLAPVALYDSGISGTSMLISQKKNVPSCNRIVLKTLY